MRLQVTFVEKPGKIGGAGPAVNDRPGDAEAGCANTDPRRVTDEAAEYVDERGVLPTGECLLVRGLPHRRSFLFKKSQDRLRSRSEEHTSELQSLAYLVCRLLLEKKKKYNRPVQYTCHDN